MNADLLSAREVGELGRVSDGGYPQYFWDTSTTDVVCYDCVVEMEDQGSEIFKVEINYEDPGLYRDLCSRRIPSAYAEDEDEEEMAEYLSYPIDEEGNPLY